jgi:hypothetical protein
MRPYHDALEREADQYLVAAGATEYTCQALDNSDRKWTNHCDQMSTYCDYPCDGNPSLPAYLSPVVLMHIAHRLRVSTDQMRCLHWLVRGYRVAEIADITDIPERTVYRQLHRALPRIWQAAESDPYCNMTEVMIEVFRTYVLRLAGRL